MVAISPLPIRFVHPGWTNRVPSPAHDSMSAKQRRAYLELNPESYLAVTRSIEDVPDGIEMSQVQLLEQGMASLERLMEMGAFTDQRAAAMYVYRLDYRGRHQDGIICGVSTQAFETGEIRAHERVLSAQRDHLVRHYQIVKCQSSPIVMAYEDDTEITRTLAEASNGAPLLDFVVSDGLRQTIWPIEEEASEKLAEILRLKTFYIIDGHHRTEAAQAYRRQVGDGTADLMLSAVFSSAEMQNHSFHRWLRSEDDSRRLLEGCRDNFNVRDLLAEEVRDRGSDELAIYHAGKWVAARVPALPNGDSLASLDPVRLQYHLLGPLVGIDEYSPRNRLDYVSGEGPIAALVAMIDGAGGALVVMRPVTMEELFAVADAGLIMPAKSTYFTPKARSGVMLRPL